MELASFLAGEKWSDHPSCTHALLAEVARLVNDHTSDPNRPLLARLIPSVIGVTSDDPHIEPRIALSCARAALPVASAERQGVMAVVILTADRTLAMIDGRPLDALEEESLQALELAPQATRWAYRCTQSSAISVERFRRHGAPNAVRCAVQGVADACVDDPDLLLRGMLADAIAVCAAAQARDADHAVVDHDAWAAACQLTGGH